MVDGAGSVKTQHKVAAGNGGMGRVAACKAVHKDVLGAIGICRIAYNDVAYGAMYAVVGQHITLELDICHERCRARTLGKTHALEVGIYEVAHQVGIYKLGVEQRREVDVAVY